jgi:tRNA(adenine34) deaminase
MNPLSKVWRNLIRGGGMAGAKGEASGRLPPVPLGWRAGGVVGVSGRSPTATPIVRAGAGAPDPEAIASAGTETIEPKTIEAPVPEITVRPVAPVPVVTSPARVVMGSTDRAEPRSVARTTTQAKATPTDSKMMARAIELAKQALALGEVPIGAVVYETASGKVLGEGYNRREIDKDPSAHAEWFAIKEAAEKVGDWRLNHCTLVVTLEPCVMCAGLVVNARLGRLVYGPRDPKAGGAESLFRLTNDPRLNHRVEPISEVMQPECARLLSEFFKSLRGKRPE